MVMLESALAPIEELDELKFVLMEVGGLFVLMNGAVLMLLLCADSWDFLLMVSKVGDDANVV